MRAEEDAFVPLNKVGRVQALVRKQACVRLFA